MPARSIRASRSAATALAALALCAASGAARANEYVVNVATNVVPSDCAKLDPAVDACSTSTR